jgi:hypothetical protein
LFTPVFNQKEERAMKRILVCIALAVLTACQPGPSQKEDKVIISVIKDECDAYLKRDHARWAGDWLHESYIKWTYITSGIRVVNCGWDSLDSFFKSDFKETTPEETKKVQYDFKIRNYGKAAFVSFDQNMYERGPSEKPDSVETFITLEKKGGKWLIADMYMVVKNNFSISTWANESNLIVAGYGLMAAKRFNEAIALLKLNVEMFPGSWNVYDSLGEAYMKSGQKALAVQNYEKSLKLNPKNKNAVEMLKKLKGR